MAEPTSTTSSAPKPATAPASSSSSTSSTPPKPPGFVDEAQAAYAEARNAIKNEEKKKQAEEGDPIEAGQKAAEQRAETASTQSEVQVEEGGGLASNDLMAGKIAQTINQPSAGAVKDTTRQARLMLRAAKAMSKHAGLATLLPPADTWGLVGQGDELNGHYVLIDLESLEKVVVTERWVIDEDRIFANAQQWPKALMQGDTLQKAAAA
jgi:hypothetical protein